MNWSYLAGFTDGDGCISIESKGRYHYARLRWAQKASASRVLDEIAEFLQSQGYKVSQRNFSVARAGHKYPQAELCITNTPDTRHALHQMLPFLVVKAGRAREALAVLDEVQALREKWGRKYRVNMRKAGVPIPAHLAG